MRLLVLVHEYPPVGGGGGRIAQTLARGLAARGHGVVVVTSHQGRLALREEDGGVDVVRLRVARKEPYRASFLSMALFVLRSLAFAWWWVRRHGVDLVHAHFAVPAGAAAYALHRLTGVPYVLTVHLGDIPGGVPEKTERWFRWIGPWTPPIWQAAARVVAVSRFSRDLALRHYRVPIEVIPNGVDVEALRPASLQVHTPPHVVFVGRFVPQKNPLHVVRILAGLQDLPWHCTMLGDGPLRAQVMRAVADLGLTERFSLPGWVTPEEVLAVMGRADVLLLPSRQEGLPLVGLQALARGLALVVSGVGGMVDLVAPGENGYVIPDPEDTRGFQDALRRLLGSPRHLLRARQASLRLARDFDLREVLTAYERLFQAVVAASAKS